MVYIVAEMKNKGILSIHQHTCRRIQAGTTKFGALKIKIEFEIEIGSSFRRDCRKDQDCYFSGDMFQELIGALFSEAMPNSSDRNDELGGTVQNMVVENIGVFVLVTIFESK
ncbi:MAG: hypothetical protein ABJL67_22805 [Sulfitobacter sp.]